MNARNEIPGKNGSNTDSSDQRSRESINLSRTSAESNIDNDNNSRSQSNDLYQDYSYEDTLSEQGEGRRQPAADYNYILNMGVLMGEMKNALRQVCLQLDKANEKIQNHDNRIEELVEELNNANVTIENQRNHLAKMPSPDDIRAPLLVTIREQVNTIAQLEARLFAQNTEVSSLATRTTACEEKSNHNTTALATVNQEVANHSQSIRSNTAQIAESNATRDTKISQLTGILEALKRHYNSHRHLSSVKLDDQYGKFGSLPTIADTAENATYHNKEIDKKLQNAQRFAATLRSGP